MLKRRPKQASISGTAFGVPVSLKAPDEKLIQLMSRSLPPQWAEMTSEDGDPREYVVTALADDRYALQSGGEFVVDGASEDVLEMLDIVLRAHIAASAPHHIFLHAGAVAVGDRAVIVPGPSFSGKTTLVTELIRAGAVYFSDEYAVLDETGAVHPYPKPLSVRMTVGDAKQTNHDVAAFGAAVGVSPVRLGIVAVTHYRPGGVWDPTPLSRAQLVVELLGAALPVQDRPEQTMSVIRAAASGAIGLRGERGDAADVARDLLARASGPLPHAASRATDAGPISS